ncbi:hypothetical protein [Paraburkholderia phymatum]|uniref:hypothetical protein n=1 Tax=Paraburkholderia phymatum TaxID=148447 RepID=UPI003D173ABF
MHEVSTGNGAEREKTEANAATGHVIAVRGAVVDVDFAGHALPPVDTALRISMQDRAPVLAEVQAHISETAVRALALQSTAGLARGVTVQVGAGPIEVPVGEAVLGRLLDVAGVTRDDGAPLPDDVARRPIHRAPPPLSAQRGATRLFELARFLFRPVADIIAQRQASAHALMNEANAAKASAQVERDALSAEREQLATQRAQALAQAEADADRQRAALLAAALEEADRLHAQAAADRARESAAQAEAASALAVQLAVDIAGKLLDRVPDSLRVAAFVDGLADGVRSLSPAARAGMASDASLQLTAPRALTPDERAACETALSVALGSTIALHAQVDRALIAGLELSGAHGIVRNSWRDQLEQIHTGLLRDDGHTR